MRFWVNLSNRRNQHSRPRQLQHQQRRLRNAVPLHAADSHDILSSHHRVGCLCLYLSPYRTTDLNKWLELFYTVRFCYFVTLVLWCGLQKFTLTLGRQILITHLKVVSALFSVRVISHFSIQAWTFTTQLKDYWYPLWCKYPNVF